MSDGIVFTHLARLTDATGLFEHAEGTEPRIEHGYCVDDVARALVVTARQPEPGPQVEALTRTYLTFLVAAQHASGRFHNRRTAAGVWADQPALGDWWGRALWGLGTAAARLPAHADEALGRFAAGADHRAPWSRAMCFAALGAAEVLSVDPRHTRPPELLLARCRAVCRAHATGRAVALAGAAPALRQRGRPGGAPRRRHAARRPALDRAGSATPRLAPGHRDGGGASLRGPGRRMGAGGGTTRVRPAADRGGRARRRLCPGLRRHRRPRLERRGGPMRRTGSTATTTRRPRCRTPRPAEGSTGWNRSGATRTRARSPHWRCCRRDSSPSSSSSPLDEAHRRTHPACVGRAATRPQPGHRPSLPARAGGNERWDLEGRVGCRARPRAHRGRGRGRALRRFARRSASATPTWPPRSTGTSPWSPTASPAATTSQPSGRSSSAPTSPRSTRWRGRHSSTPRIVPDPDQKVPVRASSAFVMSLRAVGEGHVSTIEFRTGRFGPGDSVTIDRPASRLGTGTATAAPMTLDAFRMSLAEQGDAPAAEGLLRLLPAQFTPADLDQALDRNLRDGFGRPAQRRPRSTGSGGCAASNYDLTFPAELRPVRAGAASHQPRARTAGMEDARFVRFAEDDGSVDVLRDLHCFRRLEHRSRSYPDRRLPHVPHAAAHRAGRAQQGDGPVPAAHRRHVVGPVADGTARTSASTRSDDVLHWADPSSCIGPSTRGSCCRSATAARPSRPRTAGWSSPTASDRCGTYALGAMLLDLDDPSTVLAVLAEPLLAVAPVRARRLRPERRLLAVAGSSATTRSCCRTERRTPPWGSRSSTCPDCCTGFAATRWLGLWTTR